MADDLTQLGKGQIPTNLRLVLLIEEVARAGAPVSPAKLADAIGLPRATVHRLLSTAEDEGLVQRDIDGRSFAPGLRMRRIASNTMSSQRIRTERLLIMRSLSETVQETVNLAAPDRFAMVYLDRVETEWPLRIQLPPGTKVPFHCTASGKLYLSSLRSDKLERLLSTLPLDRKTQNTRTTKDELIEELRQAQELGYATDDEEFMEGMVAIGVPITDDQGRLLTTLSIHCPLLRKDVASLKKDLPELRKAAQRMEDLLIN